MTTNCNLFSQYLHLYRHAAACDISAKTRFFAQFAAVSVRMMEFNGILENFLDGNIAFMVKVDK
jgi:hypothetical protein